MRVYQVEKDEAVVCNLDTNISLDIVKEPSNFGDCMVEYPPVILKLVVPYLLEE
jgi:hypothetical protein